MCVDEGEELGFDGDDVGVEEGKEEVAGGVDEGCVYKARTA